MHNITRWHAGGFFNVIIMFLENKPLFLNLTTFMSRTAVEPKRRTTDWGPSNKLPKNIDERIRKQFLLRHESAIRSCKNLPLKTIQVGLVSIRLHYFQYWTKFLFLNSLKCILIFYKWCSLRAKIFRVVVLGYFNL